MDTNNAVVVSVVSLFGPRSLGVTSRMHYYGLARVLTLLYYVLSVPAVHVFPPVRFLTCET